MFKNIGLMNTRPYESDLVLINETDFDHLKYLLVQYVKQ